MTIFAPTNTLDAITDGLSHDTRRQLVVLPTGTDKTVIFSQLPHRIGTPLLLLNHRTELLDQAAETIRRANPTLTVGIEQADRSTADNEDVVVASVNTLTATNGRRLDRLRQIPWTAIADKAPHFVAASFRTILGALRCFQPDGPALIIGELSTR